MGPKDTDKLVMDVFTDRLGTISGIQDIDHSHQLGPSVWVLAPPPYRSRYHKSQTHHCKIRIIQGETACYEEQKKFKG